MNYEEKYNNLVAAIKQLQEANPSDEGIQNWVEDNVPELKESEDERIRKYLITYFSNVDDCASSLKGKDIVAWLEKQVVQKPSEFDGTNAKRMFIKALERVEEQNHKGYNLTDCDKNSWWEDFKTYISCIVERKPTGWCERYIADVFEKVGLAKIVRDQGDDLLTNAVQSAMIELSKGSPIEQKPANKEYTFNAIPRLLELIQPTDKVKSYCQKLIDSLEQEGYSTDAKIVRERLELMNGEMVAMATMDEQKPTGWSEEDEKNLNTIINVVYGGTGLAYEEELEWLKSLRDRVKPPTWKPSEEQLKALSYFIGYHLPQYNSSTSGWVKFDNIQSLYNDLIKLKKE